MITKIDRRENGWFLNEERLLGIDIESVKHYRQECYWANKTLGDVIEEAANQMARKLGVGMFTLYYVA
jgi:hypothetical protein